MEKKENMKSSNFEELLNEKMEEIKKLLSDQEVKYLYSGFEDGAKWAHSKFKYTENHVDFIYLIAVLNVVGIDGLSDEMARLKSLGKKPHNIIDDVLDKT